MNKLQLFINNKQIKKLIKAYENQHFCVLKFNRQTIDNYNCEIFCEKWVINYAYNKTANNNSMHIKFDPILNKKPKSYQLHDLIESFSIY